MVSSLQIHVKIFILIRSCVEVYVLKQNIYFDFMSLVDCNNIPNSPLNPFILHFFHILKSIEYPFN